MSYDLFFQRKEPVSKSEFSDFFSQRPNYEVNGRQAWYANQDTGIYFSFDLDDPETADPESLPSIASFNLNYFRPHTFALEAAPELEAFIRQFGFEINDPQLEGMSDGQFTIEGFLKGWNAGNTFAHGAMLSTTATEASTGEPFTKPAETIELVWRWNKDRNKLQEKLSEGIFVPRIMWLQVGVELFSCVVWPDGISTLLPQVDRVIIARDGLAPRRFFLKQPKDTCLVAQNELDDALPKLEKTDFTLPCRHLSYREPTVAIKNFIQQLKPVMEKLNIIAADKVLDAELVTEARKGSSK